uniref:Uncharacterized protein n=1 Tax=Anguilla anguilla TaxID=7936 RepID=A0A0E9W1Z9_ANGAN
MTALIMHKESARSMAL